MAVTLRRQLSDSEKEDVLRAHGGRVCFATGHTVPDEETISFDHIRAFALGGKTELNNIAPMCTQHNFDKGTMSLFDFRARLRLQEFFKSGDRLTLGDLLEHLREKQEIQRHGLPVNSAINGDVISIESSAFSQNYQLSICPTTKWQYFCYSTY